MIEKEALLRSVLDVVSETGFLSPVTVQCLEQDNDVNTTCTFWCSPHATVQEIKSILREKLDLAASTENDFSSVLLDLKDTATGTNVFVHLETAKPPAATELTVRTRQMDPFIHGLFRMAGMTTEADLDDMMERIMVPRTKRDCPGSHALPTKCQVMCDLCQAYARPGRWCEECDFALCDSCFQSDEGRRVSSTEQQHASSDPYDQLIEMVKYIGREHASLVEGSGAGSGGFLWDPTLGGEVRPSIFGNEDRFMYVRQGSKILQAGTRLVILLSDKLRSVVVTNDDDAPIESNTIRRKDNALLPGETDTILRNGATSPEVLGHGRKLLADRTSWRRVTQALSNIVERAGMEGFEDAPEAYNLKMRLVSFQPHKVVYVVTAEICHIYCADRSMPQGADMYQFFDHRARTFEALQEAGAVL
ncbi:expressed unknown protein [Seminavis robusta]|uniref:Uncharacterized protein n=1 Tax=Seminavis robusta TaxID=568900 RepID=A0A9N8H4Y7_9STRA|nr:expressed unknown protein [Seminavis robusta]|eukprot:Sro127_g060950.1 n/a (419) ;mRNA; f:90289-91545